MKKRILIIMSMTFMVLTSSAQESKTDIRERFVFGMKIGTNYSNVYDSQGEDFNANPKFGLAAGAFFAIPIGKYMGIQPEILFSQKGFQGSGRMLGSNYTFTRTTSYIDVPILFAFKPNRYISLLAGPQYSYLVKQKDVFENSTFSYQQEQEFQNDNIRKNTLGFLGGIDVTVKHLVIGLRAGADIQNNNGNGSSTTPRYKNVLYRLAIGYRFYDLK